MHMNQLPLALLFCGLVTWTAGSPHPEFLGCADMRPPCSKDTKQLLTSQTGLNLLPGLHTPPDLFSHAAFSVTGFKGAKPAPALNSHETRWQIDLSMPEVLRARNATCCEGLAESRASFQSNPEMWAELTWSVAAEAQDGCARLGPQGWPVWVAWEWAPFSVPRDAQAALPFSMCPNLAQAARSQA